MGVGAAILAAGVATAGASIISSSAAGSAAQQQVDAQKYAADLQMQMFQQTQANLKPFITGGTGAFSELQRLTGTNAASPGTPGSGPTAPDWALSTAPATADQVTQLFQQFLGRAPDQATLDSLVGKEPINAVWQGIQGSKEYTGDLAAGTVKGQTGATAGTPAGESLTAPLTAPFTPTLASLEATPGYQFTLDQGLKAAQTVCRARPCRFRRGD